MSIYVYTIMVYCKIPKGNIFLENKVCSGNFEPFKTEGRKSYCNDLMSEVLNC